MLLEDGGCVATLDLNLTPWFRSTVGFDQLFSMLDEAMRMGDNAASYPPYNIEKTGKDGYRITLAVAGFADDELAVELGENTLVVTGRKADSDDDAPSYLYRGIAARAFERRFQLADHIKVVGASLNNGLLQIDLVRKLPEAMKPRRIEIKAEAPKSMVGQAKKLIEDDVGKAA